ncbi:MAG: hypothetical protein JRI36_11250 [Deltaproteobacteria bacterium]|nr:hypothetical protein [Deltaproteobacteria bacterium]
MKKVFISILFVFVAFPIHAASGPDRNTTPKIAVMLSVTESSEKDLVDDIRNLVTKALGTLEDVTIVREREQADYGLLILPTRTQTENGQDLGFGLFVLAISPFREKDFDTLVEKANLGAEKYGDLFPLRYHTTSLDHIEYLGFQAGPPQALDSLCSAIVATFDKKCLEPRRNAEKELKAKLEELIEEQKALLKKTSQSGSPKARGHAEPP